MVRPAALRVVGALALAAVVLPAEAADAERGALLAGLAGCEGCHTVDGGTPYAGGFAIESPQGTFYGTNITPDPEHGIGGWTLADFVRAMREGLDRGGRHLYPAFPYPAYTKMNDADLADLWAFLQTLPPSSRPNRPHDLGGPYGWRSGVALWNLLFLDEGPLPLGTDRGRYLVEAVGHCQECHTPRNALGALDVDAWLAGGEGEKPAPNITPSDDGVGAWTADDWDTFLVLGMLPDGDFVGTRMSDLVEHGTSKLDASDRAAMTRWMMEAVEAKPDVR